MYYSEPDVVREGESLNLAAASRVVWRYKYLVGTVTAIFIVLALIVAFETTPTYQAAVVVVPAAADSDMSGGSLSGSLSGLKGLASIAGVNIGGMNGAVADAEAVLHSHNLAEQFIRRYDLVHALIPSRNQPATIWFAVKRFREKVLTIKTDKDDGTTTVTVKWTDPNVAAQWANEFVAMANELIRNRALRESSRNIQYLNKQLASTQVVALQDAMYTLIEQQTKELMLANVRVDYAFTIDDPAVAPELRTWPNRRIILLSGLVLGFAFGAIVALLVNAVRNARADSDGGRTRPARTGERQVPVTGQHAIREEG